MPKNQIPPFETFQKPVFHIGGDPDEVLGIWDTWVSFTAAFDDAAMELSGTDISAFEGYEGDTYGILLNSTWPDKFSEISRSHGLVGDQIFTYAMAHGEARHNMFQLEDEARLDHTALVLAINDYNRAEEAAIAARVHATEAHSVAIAAALTPGAVPAAAAAAAAESAAQAAEADQARAEVHYQEAHEKWEGDKRAAQKIKDDLGEDVDRLVGIIGDAEELSTVDNSFTGDLKASLDEIKEAYQEGDWVDFFYGIADIPLLEFTQIGTGADYIGLGLHAGEVITGNATLDSLRREWTRAIPAKIGKYGKKALQSSVVREALQKPEESGEMNRQSDVTSGMEPVDMATGAWIDFKEDVHIDGVLPLRVTRCAQSNYILGDCFGPQWKTNLDCSIEVHTDRIIMQSEDGAMVGFPMPPSDGTEVKAYSRPWLISFVDGAYRVRDVAKAVTYVFATQAIPTGSPLDTLQKDAEWESSLPSQLRNVGYGLPRSSLGAVSGMGIEFKITATLHRSGHWIEFDYALNSGLLAQARRSDGTTLIFTWDPIVRKLQEIYVQVDDNPESSKLLISYSYDRKGWLRAVTNSSGKPLQYSYDDKGQIAGWIDRNGVSYWCRFDDHGRVVAQTGTGGVFANACVWLTDIGDDAPEGGNLCVAIETAKIFEKDPKEIGDSVIAGILDRLETLPLVTALQAGGLKGAGLTGCGRDGKWTDEPWTVSSDLLFDEQLGDIRPTVYRSTSVGDVWRIVKPSGACEDLEYDEYHQVIRKITPAGGEYEWKYDDFGNVIECRFPDGSTELIERGEWGVATRITDRAGLDTYIESDIVGSILSITTPSGATSTFEYGWLPSGVVPTVQTDSSGARTEFYCDKAGRILQRSDGHKIDSVVRDELGRIVRTVDEQGLEIALSYSPEGWCKSISREDGTTDQLEYDPEGNLLWVYRNGQIIHEGTFTVFDNPLTRTDAVGGVTRFIYNSQMEPVGVINADGLQWDFERDLDGRLISQCDYNGIQTFFRYDPQDRWTSTIDAGGNVTTTWFDNLGRTIRQELGDSEIVEWAYNKFDRIETITNTSTQVQYHYDQWGYLEAEETILSSGEVFWTQVSFDPTNNAVRQSTKLPTGHDFEQIIYRDSMGYPMLLDTYFNDAHLAKLHFKTDYAGRRSSIEVDELHREFTYDQRGRRIADIVTSRSSIKRSWDNAIAGRQWHWTNDNALDSIKDVHLGTTTLDIDTIGRVKKINKQSPTADFTNEEYTYSRAGVYGTMTAGIKIKTEAPHLARSPLTKKKPAQEETVRFAANQPERVGDIQYIYDEVGRIIETRLSRRFSEPLIKRWKYAGPTGQIQEFWSSDYPEHLWTYNYDGLGRRVSKICYDLKTSNKLFRQVFVHFGDDLIAETVIGTPTADFRTVFAGSTEVFGHAWISDPSTGEKIGQIDLTRSYPSKTDDSRGQFFALLVDLAGAPQELVDARSGQLVGKALQSMLGRRIWKGAVSCPLLFTGQYADEESGWVYNRFRYYDPVSGHYTSQDPLGVGPEVASSQRYVAMPHLQTDLLGLETCRKLTDDDTEVIAETTQTLYETRPEILHKWNSGNLRVEPGEKEYLDTPDGRWAKYMYRGNAIDKAFKQALAEEDFFKNNALLTTTPRGGSGPDVVLQKMDDGKKVDVMWWDFTTISQAQDHLEKYGVTKGYDQADHIIGYKHAGFQEYKHIVVSDHEKAMFDKLELEQLQKAEREYTYNMELVEVTEQKEGETVISEEIRPVVGYENKSVDGNVDLRGFVEQADMDQAETRSKRKIPVDPDLLAPKKNYNVKEGK